MRAWEKNIRSVVPYVPGEQPKGNDLIKLNTNENPYPPSGRVLESMRGIDPALLRKYPDPSSGVLVSALSKYYGVGNDQVFVGVGSDDVLAMAFLTFFNSPRPVLFPDITYSFYKVWAGLFGISYETCALDENFCIHTQDYVRPNGGVIFPNPNAPTGVFLPLSGVEEILKGNPDVVVIVDEAYIDFGGESARRLLPAYDNLLVVGTFSKSRSLAGLRIGFAMGHPDLIKALNNVKYSYNSYTMNLFSQVVGAAVLEDEAYFKETTEKIITTREWAKERFRRLGFSFPDSSSNFLFVSHKSVPAESLFLALRKARIFVRYFKQQRLENSLRVTIGTREEMEALFAFLEEYLKGVSL